MNPDVIVVGLGAMGSAALYQLAKRGAAVHGIDRFSPPHEHGSSHGETRITRQAVGEGDAYVPLVLRSHEIWREIEAETGLALFDACGGLVFAGAGSQHPRKRRFLEDTMALARQHAIPHEVLGASELAYRFPQFILKGDERAYYEPGAGMLFPERCIFAQLDLARRNGAAMLLDEPVLAIEPEGGGVRVRTARAGYAAPSVIVTAGAWNAGLLGRGDLTIRRQVLTWFEAESPDEYAPGRFPVFIALHGADDHCYGFPIPPGTAGFKIATETYDEAPAVPEETRREVEEAESDAFYDRHVAGRLRGIARRRVKAKTCLYTISPDLGFVIERLPRDPRIVLVSACSGHGFKHSAAIGEGLAELVLDGRPRVPLDAFGSGRFARPG